MSRASACLGAIHGILLARGILCTRDRVRGGRLWVEGTCVAMVSDGKIRVSSVVSHIDRVVEIVPAKDYEPTPYVSEIKTIAMEVEMRCHMNRAEWDKHETWRRAKLAGHACGKGCKESLCGIHSRPAVRQCAAGTCTEGDGGRCKWCGTVVNWDRAAVAEAAKLLGEVRHAA